MPFFRRLVYEELRAEQREAAHAQAGALRAARGEFTAAAYQYVAAGETETAVALWFPGRELEIERGQASAALDIFGAVSAKRLSRTAAGHLKLIQNQLYLLAGRSQRVIDNMAGFEWHMDGVTAAEAYYQEAQAQRNLGHTDAALEAYDRVITTIDDLVELAANSISYRSRLYLTEADMRSAHQEARRSHLFAEALDGYLAMAAGRFKEAQAHFETALTLGEGDRKDDRMVVELHRRLGYIAGSLGDVESAEREYGIAIDYYRRVGDKVNLEGVRADLSGVYLNMRQFGRFIPLAEQALRFFESIRHEGRVEQLTVHLAEAYLETDRLDEAAAYANRALVMESPRQRPYALYTLGLVHQRQGRPEHAAVAFADGISTARNNHDRFIEAYLHRLDGRLRLEQGDPAAARAALETALGLFEEMGISYEADVTRGELVGVVG